MANKRFCPHCGKEKSEHLLLCEGCWVRVPARLRSEWWEFPAHRQRLETRKSIKAVLRSHQGQRSFALLGE